MNNKLSIDLQKDLRNISQITSIPSMLNVICRTTGMRFAAVARVTDEKWVTCVSQDEINFGLKPGDELELETTICNEIRQHTNPVVIDNVPKNQTYCNHHTPEKYGFKSYISFPIFRKDGRFFGTLCAIDPEPAKLENQQTHELFQLYTELISFHLESIEDLYNTNQILLEEKKNAKLRETFIAILGHDLRNPLTTTKLCTDILLGMEMDKNAKKYVSTIKTTSLRMQKLIDNVLDFAKGELGEGISLVIKEDNNKLKKELKQIIKETKTADLTHNIVSSIELKNPVKCDSNRIGQLFSNLLSNAVKHGYESTPIYINSISSKEQFILEVINSSDVIPPDILKDIFKPFTSNGSNENDKGLGLGLYIASEIAKGHNGKIDVVSEKNNTSFKFSMPL